MEGSTSSFASETVGTEEATGAGDVTGAGKVTAAGKVTGAGADTGAGEVMASGDFSPASSVYSDSFASNGRIAKNHVHNIYVYTLALTFWETVAASRLANSAGVPLVGFPRFFNSILSCSVFICATTERDVSAAR